MKLIDLKNAEVVLRKLVTADLPIDVVFKLTDFVDEADKQLTRMEAMRVKLVKKYGEVLDNGGIEVPDDKLEEFNKEFMELMSVDVDIPVVKIDTSVLMESNIKLSVIELKSLRNIGII